MSNFPNCESIKLLTLNLHCYQERDQQAKFTQIARAINELDIEIVCLQEVAELWNDGHGNWESHSARIICDQIGRPYHLYTDWSHLGFGQYREGVAILSKYPIHQTESRYVSIEQDPYTINARKVVFAQIDLPAIGPINIFSCHLSWWSEGFSHQFEQLRRWADSKHHPPVVATFLCGDFNIQAGRQGYAQVVETTAYEDQWLKATNPALFEQLHRQKIKNWQRPFPHPDRIDYIFMHKAGGLRVISGRTLFTEQDYGRVSDHVGYLAEFGPNIASP